MVDGVERELACDPGVQRHLDESPGDLGGQPGADPAQRAQHFGPIDDLGWHDGRRTFEGWWPAVNHALVQIKIGFAGQVDGQRRERAAVGQPERQLVVGGIGARSRELPCERLRRKGVGRAGLGGDEGARERVREEPVHERAGAVAVRRELEPVVRPIVVLAQDEKREHGGRCLDQREIAGPVLREALEQGAGRGFPRCVGLGARFERPFFAPAVGTGSGRSMFADPVGTGSGRSMFAARMGGTPRFGGTPAWRLTLMPDPVVRAS